MKTDTDEANENEIKFIELGKTSSIKSTVDWIME